MRGVCRRLTAETTSKADTVRLFDKEISKHDRIEDVSICRWFDCGIWHAVVCSLARGGRDTTIWVWVLVVSHHYKLWGLWVHALATETNSELEFVGAYQSMYKSNYQRWYLQPDMIQGSCNTHQRWTSKHIQSDRIQGSSVAMVWPELPFHCDVNRSCCLRLLSYKISTVCRIETTADIDRLVLLTEGRSLINEMRW